MVNKKDHPTVAAAMKANPGIATDLRLLKKEELANVKDNDADSDIRLIAHYIFNSKYKYSEPKVAKAPKARGPKPERLIRDTPEAKAHMAQLRAMRGNKPHTKAERKLGQYLNGLGIRDEQERNDIYTAAKNSSKGHPHYLHHVGPRGGRTARYSAISKIKV